MDDFIFPQASILLGIIPALILLYISLKNCEGLYKHKTVFITFLCGIIFGFLAALMQSTLEIGVVLYVILFSVFTQLLKTIPLNLRRFQEKQETVIYGLSLGLGFGSVFTPFLLIAVSKMITSELTILVLIGVGSLGLILMHGATGAALGYGVYRGALLRYGMLSTLLLIPFNYLVDVSIIFLTAENQFLSLSLIVGVVLFGVVTYWYLVKKSMAVLFQEGKKRKRARHIF